MCVGVLGSSLLTPLEESTAFRGPGDAFTTSSSNAARVARASVPFLIPLLLIFTAAQRVPADLTQESGLRFRIFVGNLVTYRHLLTNPQAGLLQDTFVNRCFLHGHTGIKQGRGGGSSSQFQILCGVLTSSRAGGGA